MGGFDQAFDEGLSPLARGKHRGRIALHVDPRPIPAGAGETVVAMRRGGAGRAYPRWRGGNVAAKHGADHLGGLSPLARGKRRRAADHQGRQGPIPAGAGETSNSSHPVTVPRAYPRWRGGNTEGTSKPQKCKGLSPLARGKLVALWVGQRRIGPIPAGAGETCRGFPAP